METRVPAPARPAPAPSGAPAAHPPETLEGWYVLHQVYSIDASIHERRVESTRVLKTPADGEGWSAFVKLIGSRAHVMAMHLRPTLDAVGDAQRDLAQSGVMH